MRFKVLGLLLAGCTFGSQASAEVICNQKSEATNLRTGPSAKNFPIADTLKNGDSLQVLERVTNPEGFDYLKVRFKHSKTGASTVAFVYHEAIAATCGGADKPVEQAADAKPVAPVKQPPSVADWKPVTGSAPALKPNYFAPFAFNRAVAANEVLYPLCTERAKCGFIDKTGKWVVDPLLEASYSFEEGIARVVLGGKYGYLDKAGQWIAEPVLDKGLPFSEGRAIVLVGTRYGVIDNQGNWIVEPALERIGKYSGGLAAANLGSFEGYLDLQGNWRVKPVYAFAADFSEGLAAVTTARRIGYINDQGQFVIKQLYSTGWDFSGGHARVARDRKYGFVRRDGTEMDLGTYDNVVEFSEGLAVAIKDDRRGYIDASGQWAIEPRFEAAHTIKDGLAVAKDGGRYGIISKAGQWLTAPRYASEPRILDSQTILFFEDSKAGLADSAGRTLVEPVYDGIIQYEGLYRVVFGDRYGWMTREGRPLTYTEADIKLAAREAADRQAKAEQAKRDEETRKKNDEARKRQQELDQQRAAERDRQLAEQRRQEQRARECSHVYIGMQIKQKVLAGFGLIIWEVIGINPRTQRVTIRDTNYVNGYRRTQEIGCGQAYDQ